ncbi:MAG: NAD-dependent epimerase/dehydratase family protein [Elusimicrobiota bacterium]
MRPSRKRVALITGGAGFIGVNVARSFMARGWRVSVFDDLSRKGTRGNLEWLKSQGPVDFRLGDVRSLPAVRRWVAGWPGAEVVFHLAAQVAVTTSVTDPQTDFERNARGSFNVLEAVRCSGLRPLLVYSSTNKVYGGMEEVRVRLRGARYGYCGLPRGVPETQPLDFHSPYGCSKGAGDQYFHDYHRIYGLPTVVFRQSCIYGQHQNGTEDQGWLAHFMMAAQAGKGITVYGDGMQVRDVLHVDDLVELYWTAVRKRGLCAGRVYNIGGGPGNLLSLLELIAWIRQRGVRLSAAKSGWRPGDQRVYISDISKAKAELGWSPRIRVREGLRLLWDWLRARR